MDMEQKLPPSFKTPEKFIIKLPNGRVLGFYLPPDLEQEHVDYVKSVVQAGVAATGSAA